jgi:hypothetical protein
MWTSGARVFSSFSLLVLSACSGSSGAPPAGGNGGEGDAGPGFGAYDSGGGGTAGPASLQVVGTNAMGTTMVTFSGAATSESMPGVYCKLWMSASIQPFLEVLGTTQGDQSSAEIKVWDFDLGSGQSRQESFTTGSMSVNIGVQLVTMTSGFQYLPFSPMGGMCTTTIDSLTADAVSGTFACNPLPASDGTATQDMLSMTFSCPLQP